MMKNVLIFAVFLSFFSCTNSGGTEKTVQPEAASKSDSLTAPDNTVPAKVTGVFVGGLACKDCRQLDRGIVIQPDYYQITEHHQGTRDKAKLFIQYSGKIMQDSGIVTLYDTSGSRILQTYKITARDTIVSLTEKGKKTSPVNFINKEGKKLVH